MPLFPSSLTYASIASYTPETLFKMNSGPPLPPLQYMFRGHDLRQCSWRGLSKPHGFKASRGLSIKILWAMSSFLGILKDDFVG